MLHKNNKKTYNHYHNKIDECTIDVLNKISKHNFLKDYWHLTVFSYFDTAIKAGIEEDQADKSEIAEDILVDAIFLYPAKIETSFLDGARRQGQSVRYRWAGWNNSTRLPEYRRLRFRR